MKKRGSGYKTAGATDKKGAIAMSTSKELENIRERFEQGANPTKLLNEMELIFKIPALNDQDFNEANPEVMELYRTIGNRRSFRGQCHRL